MTYKKFSFLFLVLAVAGTILAQAPHIDISAAPHNWKMKSQKGFSDAGTQISTAGYDASSWLNATVPGTIFSTLVDNPGTGFSDPYVDRNIATQCFEKGIDIARDMINNNYGYWYRTTFSLDANLAGRKLWLRFKGINYRAEVYCNGQRLNNQEGKNTSTGAFKHFYFDITSIAKLSETNAVAVRILPNSDVDTWHQVTAQDHQSNGGQLSIDGPTFSCSDGWDWIPTIPDRNNGIYDQVMIDVKGPVAIRDPFVSPALNADFTKADITVSALLENSTGNAVSGTLYATIDGIEKSTEVSLAANEKKTATLYITVNSPKLWWPNGYGEQNLYDCKYRFEENSKISDSTTVRFGCRKISYEIIQSWLTVFINDKKIMCKGGNWGMDEAMKRWDPERLEMQMRWHKVLNTTMIRNWVGQTDRELFYDLADKYGILMFDDFWVPHPADGPDPSDKALFMDHAREKLKRCRNHPCIAIYCGKNEGDRNGLFNTELTTAINELHPGIRYLRWSTAAADGVHGNGPYGWRPLDNIWNEPKGFTSEIGMTSVWVDRTARRTLSEDKLAPVYNAGGSVISAEYGWHDFCGASAMNGNQFCSDLINKYGIPAATSDKFATNKTFCQYAQVQNYDGYRTMFEAYNMRLSASTERTSGILIWMSNSSWPSNVWQTYDYFGDANAAAFGLQKACEPIHIQASFKNATYQLEVINNTFEALANCKVTCDVWNVNGTKQGTQNATVTAAALANTGTGITVNSAVSTTNAFLFNVVLKDANDKILSTNAYARAKNNDWTQMKALNTMAKVSAGNELTGSFVASSNGTMISITGKIKNTTSNKIAHLVRLTLLKKGVTESGSGSNYVDPRILPTYYTTNYFTVFPGDSQEVTMEYEGKYADGHEPQVEITGFNINDATLPVTGNTPVTHFGAAPAMEQFTVNYVPSQGVCISNPVTKQYSVSLFSMLGKKIVSKQNNGGERMVINAQNLPRGLYVVRIVGKDHTSKVARVMIP